MRPGLDSVENLPLDAPSDTHDSEYSDPAASKPDTETAPAEQPDSEAAEALRRLADSAERYHDRAQQREGVIDYLHAELELLRRESAAACCGRC